MSRSGFVIEVPLGLWSSMEFVFEVSENGGQIEYLDVHLADGAEEYDLPSSLREFAAVYAKTWMLSTKGPSDDISFERQPWVDARFWHKQTLARLEDLHSRGLARWEDDLDGVDD